MCEFQTDIEINNTRESKPTCWYSSNVRNINNININIDQLRQQR